MADQVGGVSVHILDAPEGVGGVSTYIMGVHPGIAGMSVYLIETGPFTTVGQRTFPLPNAKTVWQSQSGKRTFPMPGEQNVTEESEPSPSV